MNRDVAEQLSLFMWRHHAELNSMIWVLKMKGGCDEDQYKAYRLAIAGAMAALHPIMDAVYREHPDLRPSTDDGPYEIDDRIYAEAMRMRREAGVPDSGDDGGGSHG
jgi:hypothetical protein